MKRPLSPIVTEDIEVTVPDGKENYDLPGIHVANSHANFRVRVSDYSRCRFQNR